MWRRVVLANLLPGVLVSVVGMAFAPLLSGNREAWRSSFPYEALALGNGWFLFAFFVLRWQVRHNLSPATIWLVEGRPATIREGIAVRAVPRRMAVSSGFYWAAWEIFVPIFYRASVRLDALSILKVELGFASGALSACCLTYLFVEEAMRSTVALTVDDPLMAGVRSVGILPRLLLTWLVTSAIPLGGIGLVWVGIHGSLRASARSFTETAIVAAIVFGAVGTYLAARRFHDPLRRLQLALARVQEGNLDVQLAVDDGTEIGLAQAGFNRMVKALRERDRLNELLGRHVGTDVAALALGHGGAMAGEVRQVTVLFSDVVGSTRLARRQPPTKLVEMLNAFFEAVVNSVKAEGGWVNKFEGDGALCVFGAPNDLDDQAGCALRAARSLRAEVERLSVKFPGFKAASGISTGHVVAGYVGAAERYEYTVIGDAVNEAARLRDAAKRVPNSALASAATVEAAGAEAANWRLAGTFWLRGRGVASQAFSPLGAETSGVASAPDARVSRPLI